MKKYRVMLPAAVMLCLSAGCSSYSKTPAEVLKEEALYCLEYCETEALPAYEQGVDWEKVPVFTEYAEVMAYLDACYQYRNEQICFIMEGEPPGSDVFYGRAGMMTTTQDLYQMDYESAAFPWEEPEQKRISYVSYAVQYSTGVLVLDAYQSGDTSRLDETDLAVYEMVVEFVEHTLDKTASLLVQERQIYDYICSLCAYYDKVSEGEREDFRMASGVFLDGKANCMGYADAFYMLGNMAGFEVEMDLSDEMNHSWNLITLDGKKYIVDVTENTDSIPYYSYFNAGLDIAAEWYIWEPDSLTAQVVPESDENYFYFAQEEGFAVRADSPEALCDLAAASVGEPLYVVYTGTLSDIHQKISDRLAEVIETEVTLTTSFKQMKEYTFVYIYAEE